MCFLQIEILVSTNQRSASAITKCFYNAFLVVLCKYMFLPPLLLFRRLSARIFASQKSLVSKLGV